MSNAAEPIRPHGPPFFARTLSYLRSALCLRDALLVLLTLSALAGVCGNGLVNFDDNHYAENLNVQGGVSVEGIVWAFTTTTASNWHPLTWLSLQLDQEWFSPAERAFHRTNLVLHVANVLLLAEVLRRLTGRLWASAAVGALFAVHPLHVESVAWVSERKDVLSTFFGVLALAAYVSHARDPGPRRLALVALAYAASLLAKPMLVTLPCLLFLLDYWPLCRLAWGQSATATSAVTFPTRPLRGLLLEKLPLVLLAVGSCGITLLAQGSGGAIKSLDRFPLGQRLANAIDATRCYLVQTFWPVNLAAYYPYPMNGLPWTQVLGAGLLLFGITLAVCWLARSRPYLPVGWFWFLGTLVPVIGLVQVGSQAHADRYTYVPHIGLFLMVVWGVCDLLPARRRGVILGPLTAGVLAVCVVLTRAQVRHWADSLNLWEHTLAVTSPNAFAEAKYGEALRNKGNDEEAMVHLLEAVRLDPRIDPAFDLLARIYISQNRLAEAAECYRQALKARPDSQWYLMELQRLEGEKREDKETPIP